MPARKRPFPKPGEPWNQKKHANRRKTRPIFKGQFMTGEKVVARSVGGDNWTGVIEDFDKEGRRGMLMFYDHPATVYTSLGTDRRKKSYRYRKKKK